MGSLPHYRGAPHDGIRIVYSSSPKTKCYLNEVVVCIEDTEAALLLCCGVWPQGNPNAPLAHSNEKNIEKMEHLGLALRLGST